jgi:cytochrome c-type biogenesis protein CcsB
MKLFLRFLPICFLALFVTEMVAVLTPRKEGALHTAEFGRLPVLLNGRVQPIDSVARNSLLQIRSTGDLPLEIVPGWKFWHHPPKLKSTEWLLEVMFKPSAADDRRVFLVHHPELIDDLKLAGKGVEKSGLYYFSFNELGPSLAEINNLGRQADKVADANRTPLQTQTLKLAHAVFLYRQLKNSVQPEDAKDFDAMVTGYGAILKEGVAAVRARQAGQPANEDVLKNMARFTSEFEIVANYALPLMVPPRDPSDKDAWENVGASLLNSLRAGDVHPAVGFYARMATAYSQGNEAEFNDAVAGYKQWMKELFPRETQKGRAEYYYNKVKLFLHATIIYIAAFALACGALVTLVLAPRVSESLRRSAFYLICLSFTVHTGGLIFRMMLEGRPPVTNLYSSAVFIGWGTCLLGIVLERVYKVGLGSAVAGVSGFVTLLIAHNLALGGDTMEMLRAVLDTNFWLTTHVVVITYGYSAAFAAGGLAIAYVLLGVFTPMLTAKLDDAAAVASSGKLDLAKALTKMVYAIVCFTILFSFVGTVLGGIWADQSWGRFWGWDPKENGALLIVLWYAIVLHARWGGLIRDRGLMNLCIFGNVVTSFSWFGVNMLGIGLHSYGFMDAAFKWLMLFFIVNIAVIGLGLLPLNAWRSFRNGKT